MKAIKLLFFIIIQIHCCHLNSQVVFNDHDTLVPYLSSIVELDGKYFVLVQVQNDSGALSNTFRIYDSLGQLLQIDTASTMNSTDFGLDILKVDSTIFSYTNFSNAPPFPQNSFDVKLTQFNSNLESINSQTFGGSQGEATRGFVKINDNFYLIAANLNVSNSYFLFKTAENCTPIDTFQYELEGHKVPLYACNSTLNTIISMGSFFDFVEDNWQIYISEIDTNGIVKWERIIQTPFDCGPTKPISLKDHSILFGSSKGNFANSNIGHLYKVDQNGEIIWRRTYFCSKSFSICPVSENEDGTIIAYGRYEYPNGSITAKIYKISPTGTTIWEKEYYTNFDSFQFINGLTKTADDGYFFTGISETVDSSNFSGWLVKTNCWGEEGSQYPVSGIPCEDYDCTQYPISAQFTPSQIFVDLANSNGNVQFENHSANVISRLWDFGDGSSDYTDSIVIHTYTSPGVYNAQLIAFHGKCTDTSQIQITVDNTTGVTALRKAPQKTISPNPSEGLIHVQFEKPVTGTLDVFTTDGKLIQQFRMADRNELEIELEESGLYLFHFTFKNGLSQTDRIVIK